MSARSLSSAADPATIPVGAWGSQSIGMTVTATGATVSFCCATGSITGPLTVAGNGSFSFQGTYGLLGRAMVSATYSGVLSGKSMSLLVTAAPYDSVSATLTEGQQPNVICPCPFIPAPSSASKK